MLCLRGAALLRLRRGEEAEQVLRRAVGIYPEFARAHEELGVTLAARNRLESAIEHLRRAVELDPKSGSALMALGKALAALGQPAEADEAFERAFALTPNRYEIARAAELFHQGEKAEAEKICRDVLSRDSNNVDALRFLAEIAASHQEWTDAEALLQRAVAIAPGFVPSWRALIDVYREQDKFAEALRAVDGLLAKEPDNPNYLCERASVLTLSGRHADAVAAFKKALAVAPKHAGSLGGPGPRAEDAGTNGRGDRRLSSLYYRTSSFW